MTDEPTHEEAVEMSQDAVNEIPGTAIESYDSTPDVEQDISNENAELLGLYVAEHTGMPRIFAKYGYAGKPGEENPQNTSKKGRDRMTRIQSIPTYAQDLNERGTKVMGQQILTEVSLGHKPVKRVASISEIDQRPAVNVVQNVKRRDHQVD